MPALGNYTPEQLSKTLSQLSRLFDFAEDTVQILAMQPEHCAIRSRPFDSFEVCFRPRLVVSPKDREIQSGRVLPDFAAIALMRLKLATVLIFAQLDRYQT